MKYVIIIPDGGADKPLSDLDGKTPLEAAQMPATDELAEHGRLGTSVTTPKGMLCGSDVCSMSLLGYDPSVYHTGRAPLEAAALGIDLDPNDWIFRVNIVTILEGEMRDHSAGHISETEARQLINDIAPKLHLPGMMIYPGVSYRNIMVDQSARIDVMEPRDWEELKTHAAHDIIGTPISKVMPVGSPHVELLTNMIHDSAKALEQHDINLTRLDLGDAPATHLWPWGQGKRPNMPTFEERFDTTGAMITAVDLLAGIAHFIGFDRLDVPGQTSYHDNDYAAAGTHAIAALDRYDLVVVHLEAPDEASHNGDAVTKTASLEAIDKHIVGPVHQALKDRNEPWRILMMPDHYTRCETRVHDETPSPFLLAGHKFKGIVNRPYTEANANEADLHIANGHDLMEYFLFAGL